MGNRSTGDGPFHTHRDWSGTTPSVAIVDAIATLENTDPWDLSRTLDSTLFDHVDPEALDTLVTGDGPLTVSLRFGDYTVRIDGSELTIDPQ